MTTYNTEVHGPAATAPTVTGKVARCKNCGIRWQVQSEEETDAQACNFCGAGKEAIVIVRDDIAPQTNIVGGTGL